MSNHDISTRAKPLSYYDSVLKDAPTPAAKQGARPVSPIICKIFAWLGFISGCTSAILAVANGASAMPLIVVSSLGSGFLCFGLFYAGAEAVGILAEIRDKQ